MKNAVSKNQIVKLQDAKNQSFADTPISAHSRGMLDFHTTNVKKLRVRRKWAKIKDFVHERVKNSESAFCYVFESGSSLAKVLWNSNLLFFAL